jgi:3-polyprenyl-4-hydroxybenzoate decarboxylase
MKTVLPSADFVIEGCVDPRERLRDEGPLATKPAREKCEV